MVFAFILTGSFSAAADEGRINDCSPKSIMGKVSQIKERSNRLYVIDNLTEREWDFFVHDNVFKSVKTGDYVRVYFNCPRFPALSVQKMTQVEYAPEGKNKGYLLKRKEEK